MMECILMMRAGQVTDDWPAWEGKPSHVSVQLLRGATTAPGADFEKRNPTIADVAVVGSHYRKAYIASYPHKKNQKQGG